MSFDQFVGDVEVRLDALKAARVERERTIQPNECPACGNYRLDGAPPEIHEHGCPYESDGFERSIRRLFYVTQQP